MKRRRFLTVTVGVLLLSAGLVFMTDRAGATPKDKSGVNPTQNSWDENLSGSSRFVVLSAFGGAAVRDNNTGLVWEQAPDALIHNWLGAIEACVGKNVGGTVGWRLPSVVELNSVRDPSLPAPFIPASVFSGLQLAGYWSATTLALSEPPSSAAWGVHFGQGDVGGLTKSGGTLRAWCVRGPMNADQY